MGWMPAVGGAVEGGSTISNYLGSIKRGKAPSIMDFEWEGVPAIKGAAVNNILGKLNYGGTPYQTNPAFETTQPDVEAATESTILGKLGNLPKSADYKAQVEASKTQQIAREKERATAAREEEMGMYNRLGLVSSTPWLTREGELGDESLNRQKDIETGMDIYGLDYGLKADQLAENIANQWVGQGQVLGSAQRGYQQNAMQLSEQDISRMSDEELRYLSGALQYLGMGGVSPEAAYGSRLFQWQQPNEWDWLASGARNTWGGILGQSGG